MNKTISEIQHVCIESNIPFASWQLPGEGCCKTIIAAQAQQHDSPDISQLRGFLAAPFEFLPKNRLWLIPDEISLKGDKFDANKLMHITKARRQKAPSPSLADSKLENYKEQFIYLKHLFEQGQLSKAVLSRIKTSTKINRGNAAYFFQLLRKAYPHAMIYLFNIPEKGLWIGATPETLIRRQNQVFLIQSVAGTHTSSLKNRHWTEKEIEEQDFVTRFIQHVLLENEIKEYQMKGPEEYRAGNLVHLKTDFILSAKNLETKLNTLIKDLHPTPAVCGLPKKRAFDEIINIEQHDRSFYSGFIGPVGMEENLQLFVNLRCMQVFDDYAALYIGGGLTHDSNPESEWQETEHKSRTLLNTAEKL